MSKILTNELIKQIIEHKTGNTIQEWQRKMVLEHYEVEFTDMFGSNCGYYIYGESTRDGYEVFVAAEDVGNVCISEDVYYSNFALHDALADAIKDELSPIYLDDEDADFVDYAIEELYQELYDEKYQEAESELEDQGYKWPKKVEA